MRHTNAILWLCTVSVTIVVRSKSFYNDLYGSVQVS